MYKALIVFFVSITSLAPFYLDRAFALDCPKPPEQVKKEWEVQVNTAVLKIGPVKGVELQTRVKNTTNDLLAKLPDAAWVYLELMMYSGYCSALRDDKTITESKKAQLLMEYNSIVRKTLDAKLNPQQKAQAEMLRQATAETVRQLSDVSRKATAEIQETLLDIKQRYENCMEANTAYTHKKLEDLNKSLVKLYSQRAGIPDEDAKEWALKTLENAREFKKEMEELEESRKKYNEGLSKDILEKTYRLFHYIFETVDSRLIILQEINPRVKYETSDKLILFNDEKTKTGNYTFRTVVLPKGNRILIYCVPGELKQGLVSKCPVLEFIETVEGKKIQFFKIYPHYGGVTMTIIENEVQFKKERILKDVRYSATGEEMLTEQFRAQFNETFKEFFNIAYAR
jgi:hypothetical protein